MSNALLPSHHNNDVQIAMHKPRNGVMTHYRNNMQDGIETYSMEIRKNGRTVAREEVNIYSTN